MQLRSRIFVLVVLCLAASSAMPSELCAEPAEVDKSIVRRGYLLSPQAFRSAADKVLPSLVTIESFGGVAISPGAKVGKRTASSGISKPGEGPTTGLVISPDGHIITSTFNFIKKPPIITVTLRDGSQYVATMLGRDETRKLCVLKIEPKEPLPVPELVSREELQVGQWAISLGVGYGDSEPAFSAGIISAKHRISGRAVQTDANISPANYGGPLIDIDGRVIGICSPLTPSGAGAPQPPGGPQGGNTLAGVEWYDSGIGFAVPLAGAERIVAQLKEGKTVVPGKIGIKLGEVKDGVGAKVTEVVDNSPAAAAGLKIDDQIVTADGQKVFDIVQLRSIVGGFVAGDELKLGIQRGEESLDITITLSATGQSMTANPNADEKKPTDKEE